MKELLLDTHILIWWLIDDSKLSPSFRTKIENTSSIYTSTVSLLEVFIKEQLGKLKVPSNLQNEIKNQGFKMLNLEPEDLIKFRELPLHHRDPFDRLLIAQAQARELTILTADKEFKKYKIELAL